METYGKLLNLSNEQGDFLTVVLRKYRPGDEEDMIACIRDEYGESYFKKDLYNGEYIKKKSEEGGILPSANIKINMCRRRRNGTGPGKLHGSPCIMKRIKGSGL